MTADRSSSRSFACASGKTWFPTAASKLLAMLLNGISLEFTFGDANTQLVAMLAGTSRNNSVAVRKLGRGGTEPRIVIPIY
jgi:hypothetical protein